MSHDPLLARADAAMNESRALLVDRCAISHDVEATRAALRETVIDSMATTDRSITSRLLRGREPEPESFCLSERHTSEPC
jgi:hypothetical protein